ncbi:ATP-binding protein [Candidatus Halobeggiatoa sp. HSG11]|nr:ATP-binding protein [Candidatus Halobeggiatoa sp. HSG11]
MNTMNNKALSIKTILWFFIIVIIITLLSIAFVFIKQQTKLQNKLIYSQLQQVTSNVAQRFDKEIELAQNSVRQLKGYIPILDMDVEKKVAFLQNMMANNLQFNSNHYSNYIAFEAKKANQYFKQRGKLLLAHKNISLLDTVRYNKPQHVIHKSINRPSYANDPRKSWYYLSKHTPDMQITPIYFDNDYTKTTLISLSQGLYEYQTFEGVVGISILVDTFFEDVENKRFGDTGYMFLVDYNEGIVLSTTNDTRFVNSPERQNINLYTDDNSMPFWKNVINEDTPYLEVPNDAEELYTLSSKKLRLLPWTLVSYQKTSELKDNSQSSIGFLIFIIGFIILLLFILMFIFFKMLILPLRVVRQSIKNFTKPNQTFIVPPKAVIELQVLATDFKAVTTKLIKINHEKNECVKTLQNTIASNVEQEKQLEQCQNKLRKLHGKTKLFQTDLEKSHLEIQKARVKIQKYKLDSKRAKVQTRTADQTKTQFLANMGLELRTPMNAIIGYTEMLQEDAKELQQNEFLFDLQKIHGASFHLLDLINNLFDMSQIESSQLDLYLETFDIAPMIQDVVATVTPLLEKRSNILKVSCDPALGTMSADLTKVRQNLINLLSNANKFSKQSIITLDVTREAIDGSDWIMFHVIDQGIGMVQEQIEKLFQAFAQFEIEQASKGNVSLSLAVTKQFCQIMGGDISVESQFGQGSTFTMRLPAQVTPVEK